jgi:general stress protein 26
LTTVGSDGRPHAVPVGVVLDHEERCAWVIASRTSHKVRRILAGPTAGVPVAACQVDGKRWYTLEGRATVLTDAEAVCRAEDRYALRYRAPRPNPMRVAIRIEVDRFLMSASLSR